MRIGFDAKRAFANKTGLGNYSRFVLESLIQHEKANDYFAYTSKRDFKLFPEFPQTSIVSPLSFLDRKLSAYWRYSTITNQLKNDGIDVFHGLSNEIPQGLSKAGIGSVVTIHDLIFEKLPSHFKAIDRAIYRHKFRSACERADAVVAVSEQTKRDLIELYKVDKHKIKVVYQDCNPVFNKQTDPAQRAEICKLYGINGPYVLCVGTLEERKNQLRLTEAFAKLNNKEFKLVLIGKPTHYTESIRDFISKNKLESQVIILHNVPTAHLPALYQEAEVFAYLSIYEGFGIPIVEALHSGTPVIAAKGSCLEEAGGPGGLYADPLDVDDIRNQLQILISDKGLRQSLTDAGKIHVQKFSGEHIAARLSDIYKEVKKQYS
ncbi:glycosyltransferase family 4 protein [Dyadobacter psychrotolerans]|uniref:Glycosyltransferase family 1 protein n=1 Tax=Dyadobacter psychrotolerans TaxID=2541721 RepID=A0A4V2Z4H6_9BACT|nr:glycosyltransferase family 1 protein [Dyadobacter psychrotolerans]TDE16738.1 glycosyltransferase family 1 protein [Dyadobacter psychrotolerans]